MVNATVDNTPISVTLGSNETYSPASGSVQKVQIVGDDAEGLKINDQRILKGRGTRAHPPLPVVLTDSDTVEVGSEASSFGFHISGFEVSN